jgi:hypothetical protein
VLANDDDAFVPAAIGFPFNFYGTSQTNAFLSSNALITFVLGSADFSNDSLTGPVIPDVPTIAPLWDDWVTLDLLYQADAVYYQTFGDDPGERRFVVQWNLMKHFGTPNASSVTFQAVLYEGSNAIEYRYLDTDTGDGNAFGGSATVGIRDTAGHLNGRNLQWSHNQAVIGNQSAIRFCPPNEDDDHDGLNNRNESLFHTLLNNADSDRDGIVDGNDDANHNRVADEDEDDQVNVCHHDRDHDGTDDEDEDD